MRIGLIGWYGHANAGDERILYCLRRFYRDHELLVVGGFVEAISAVDELNRCDWVLLGGGGLILRRFGVYASLIERLRTRFGCVGISVEALHRDNRQLIDAIEDKAEFILVRDQRSRLLLGNRSKVIVGPDLTFLYPFEVINPVREDACGINLRDWPYWRWEYNGSIHRLMQRLHRRLPRLKDVYPLPKWEPQRAISALRGRFATLRPIPMYSEPGHKTDASVLREFGLDTLTEFSPDLYDRCRYFVGMRLHGVVFACQKGIPFVSLSYQPKNAAFCKDIGLPSQSVDPWHLSQLEIRVSETKARFGDLRGHLLEYRSESSRRITHIMTTLGQLMGTTQ